MSAEHDHALPGNMPPNALRSATTADSTPRTKRMAALAMLAALVVVLIGWLIAARPQAPPVVALEGVDPAVRDAVLAARARVVKAPRSATAWGHLGIVLRAHDFSEAANVALAQAARLDPAEPRWPYLQGHALVQTPAKGIPYLETAVTLSRDRPSAPRLKLAEVLLELGRHAEAEVHCQRVLEIEADEPRAHLGLARIALAREQWSQAEEHLRHCTSSPFARQRALSLLATALRRMPGREHDAAVAAAQAQLPPPDLDFDSFDPFADEADPVGVGKNHGLAAAMTLNMKGRRREAAMVLRALAREYPDDSWILVKLIEFQLRDGDVAGAAAVARDTTQQDPQSAQAHFYLGVALFHLATDRPQKPASPEIESLDPAVQHLRRAVQLKPDHGYAFNYLGQALSKTRRSSEAYQAFVDAARCYPGFADPHLHSANLWLDLGCAPLAAFHLHQATRLTARDDPRVQQILARICFIRSLHGFP